jgi:hypothetical protein
MGGYFTVVLELFVDRYLGLLLERFLMKKYMNLLGKKFKIIVDLFLVLLAFY